MSKSETTPDELRPEYDDAYLKGGVRGKYAKRYAAGSNVVRLAPDVASAFPTEDSVNEALRKILRSTAASRD